MGNYRANATSIGNGHSHRGYLLDLSQKHTVLVCCLHWQLQYDQLIKSTAQSTASYIRVTFKETSIPSLGVTDIPGPGVSAKNLSSFVTRDRFLSMEDMKRESQPQQTNEVKLESNRNEAKSSFSCSVVLYYSQKVRFSLPYCTKLIDIFGVRIRIQSLNN